MIRVNGKSKSINVKSHQFYRVASILDTYSKKESFIQDLEVYTNSTRDYGDKISAEYSKLIRVNSNVLKEIQLSTKTNPFKDLSEQQQDASQFMPQLQGNSFLRVVLNIFQIFDGTWNSLADLGEAMVPPELCVFDFNKSPISKNMEDRQFQMMEFQMNAGAIDQYIQNCQIVSQLGFHLLEDFDAIARTMERYYEFLHHRHSVDGVKVHRDSLITDVAITIFENMDAQGEIASGKTPNEISAYTAGQAIALAGAVKQGYISELLAETDQFQTFVQINIGALRSSILSLIATCSNILADLNAIIGFKDKTNVSEADFASVIDRIQMSDPTSIVDKSEDKLLNQQELYVNKFQNETLDNIVKLISDKNASLKDLVDYCMERKAQLTKHHQQENSFYTCKISSGNPFLGEAPGALQVMPAPRPNTDLDSIIGSGYDEVRAFIRGIDGATQWNDLFLATSPRKKVDRQHLLLIGPPGTGKTEIMRGVATDKKSVGIFAQGSDFLTCWKGEAEKNPKRLYQEAIKIQKASKRHVHILIDEIDSILNNDKSTTDVNLTLEFQILMDGMISYPHISVWGATNNPERIPLPMIRRFKLLIVGELDNDQRQHLLKHYVNFLPTKDFNPDVWEEASKKLVHATGDVIAKVAESLWRDKMTAFVGENKKEATNLTDELHKEGIFNITEFDEKLRFNFKKKLGKYVFVKPDELIKTIDDALKTVGISTEIESARETYERARMFVANISHANPEQRNSLIKLR